MPKITRRLLERVEWSKSGRPDNRLYYTNEKHIFKYNPRTLGRLSNKPLCVHCLIGNVSRKTENRVLRFGRPGKTMNSISRVFQKRTILTKPVSKPGVSASSEIDSARITERIVRAYRCIREPDEPDGE